MTIGHNNPPAGNPLRDRLAEDHAALIDRRDQLLDAAQRAPAVVATEEQAGRVADFVKQLQACSKSADMERTAEKEPYLEGGRVIDAFFKGITDPLAGAKRDMESRLSAYMQRKAEAERQRLAAASAAELARTRGDYGSTATLKTAWVFDEIDRAKIDLEALRPYIPQDALDKAVRAAIRAGVRDILGVRIYQAQTATVR